MKKTNFAQSLTALVIAVCLTACNNSSNQKAAAAPLPVTQADTLVKTQSTTILTEADLIGTWKTSEYLDEAAVAKVIGEENGDKGSMTFSGTDTYYPGGTSKSSGQMTVSFSDAEGGSPLSMKFNFNITNTWKLNGNELLTTIVDSKMEPADEETKELINLDPSIAENFQFLKGETEKAKILNHTPTLIELETETKIRMTMHKEQ